MTRRLHEHHSTWSPAFWWQVSPLRKAVPRYTIERWELCLFSTNGQKINRQEADSARIQRPRARYGGVGTCTSAWLIGQVIGFHTGMCSATESHFNQYNFTATSGGLLEWGKGKTFGLINSRCRDRVHKLAKCKKYHLGSSARLQSVCVCVYVESQRWCAMREKQTHLPPFLWT